MTTKKTANVVADNGKDSTLARQVPQVKTNVGACLRINISIKNAGTNLKTGYSGMEYCVYYKLFQR